MKKTISMVGIAAAAMLAASAAKAEKCEGFSSRQYAKPIAIHKSKDGATTYLIGSTGTNTIKSPAKTAGTGWQHCNGMWTIKADKSGSGFGNCYNVDADGDYRNISWEGTNAGGTWAATAGTGKWANSKDRGTWKNSTSFADGVRIGVWEGTCGE